MSVRIKVRGDKTIIETDKAGDANLHHLLREYSPRLIASMKTYKIDKLEVRGGTFARSRLYEELDKEVEKAGFGKTKIRDVW